MDNIEGRRSPPPDGSEPFKSVGSSQQKAPEPMLVAIGGATSLPPLPTVPPAVPQKNKDKTSHPLTPSDTDTAKTSPSRIIPFNTQGKFTVGPAMVPTRASAIPKTFIQGKTGATAQPSTDGIKEKEQSLLGKILSSIISKFTKLVSPKGLEVNQDQVNNFKAGLQALPSYDGDKQTTNAAELKNSIHKAMDTNYEKTKEGSILDHGDPQKGVFKKKGVSWDPDTCKGASMTIEGTTSTGKTHTVEITPEMQKDQQENTVIYITKGSQLEGEVVKDAATHGAPEGKRELMQDRAVVSPVYIFADGNGQMHEAPPVRAIMVVESAQDMRGDSRLMKTDKQLSADEVKDRDQAMQDYETRIKKQTALFIKASLKQGANQLIDCGFGQGAFIKGADTKKTNEVFARMWVAEMVAAIKKNPKLEVVFTHFESSLIEAIKKELANHPKEEKNITFTDKMTIDVVHLAGQRGLTPAFRLAGDSSGVMGQYATQKGKMDHVAQDEQVYCTSTGGMQNVHLQKAKVIKNA